MNLPKNEMPCINILFIEDLPSDIALQLPLFIHGFRSFCRPLVVLLCKLLSRASTYGDSLCPYKHFVKGQR